MDHQILHHPKARPALENPDELFKRFKSEGGPAEAHLWFASSGSSLKTSSDIKLIALSQGALLSSARSVNGFLGVKAKDTWLNALPTFHVGGLGVLLRAQVAGSECIDLWTVDYKWNPEHWYKALRDTRATFTSLVPTQLYDIVAAGYKAPSTIKAILVGGGALNLGIRKQAVLNLGWPILPTYGMTELASQIATLNYSDLNQFDAELQVLDHVEVYLNQNNHLQLRSESLMSAEFLLTKEGAGFKDQLTLWPKGSLFTSSDLGRISMGPAHGKRIKILGRSGDVVKVQGELVSLNFLRSILEDFLFSEKNSTPHSLISSHEMAWALNFEDDVRLGAKLVFYTSCSLSGLVEILKTLNRTLPRFQQLRVIKRLAFIPYSEALKKPLYQQLASMEVLEEVEL